MQIGDRTVVSFHYLLRDDAGEELESSFGDSPTSYLHGANNIIRGLESAMQGRSAGEQFEVTLSAREAYGERNEALRQRVPVKHLVYKGRLQPGRVVQLSTDKGMRSVTVTKVGRHSADIDSNHPLAGRQLNFLVEIADVREATQEEVDHGHAHGPGGHQH
jgi:FKBP-type peptidyl-prolyl cis-trans isomerase SlyD